MLVLLIAVAMGLVVAIASVWASVLIGQAKNRDLAGWLLGILLGPVGVMLMFCVPARPETAEDRERRARRQERDAERERREEERARQQEQWQQEQAARDEQWLMEQAEDDERWRREQWPKTKQTLKNVGLGIGLGVAVAFLLLPLLGLLLGWLWSWLFD